MTEIKVNKSPYTEKVAGATRIEAPEFTHLAQEGIFPHFGRITIEYVPRETVLDGDSVGEYFIGFRDMKLNPEEAVQMICDELVAACEPMMMNVQSQYSPRHGMATNPQARFMHPDAQQQKNGARIIAPR